MKIETGLVHVYTGYAKGKTTAAFGLALRALGNGLRVLVVQFLKGMGDPSGEVKYLSGASGAEIIRLPGQRHPLLCKVGEECDIEKLKDSVYAGFTLARNKIISGNYDLALLDEINNCMREGWLDWREMAGLIKERPPHVELVLTGRGCPKEIIDLADYVTEMHLVKHPAQKGAQARKGVEY